MEMGKLRREELACFVRASDSASSKKTGNEGGKPGIAGEGIDDLRIGVAESPAHGEK
jgi:hypothetical protein